MSLLEEEPEGRIEGSAGRQEAAKGPISQLSCRRSSAPGRSRLWEKQPLPALLSWQIFTRLKFPPSETGEMTHLSCAWESMEQGKGDTRYCQGVEGRGGQIWLKGPDQRMRSKPTLHRACISVYNCGPLNKGSRGAPSPTTAWNMQTFPYTAETLQMWLKEGSGHGEVTGDYPSDP